MKTLTVKSRKRMRNPIFKILLLWNIIFSSLGLGVYNQSPHKMRMNCAQFLIDALGSGEEERGSGEKSRWKVAQELKRFVDMKFLAKEQDKALKANLEKRGVECSGGGYYCLKKISKKNISRILAGFSIELATATSDLAELYDRIQETNKLQFIHNSHHLKSKNPVAILSAKRLKNIGLPGGLNTYHFNDVTLGGADQVFFFVNHSFDRRLDGRVPKNFYGPYAAIPDMEYAEQRGWVSPFIMYSSDLTNVAKGGWGLQLELDPPGYPSKETWLAIRKLHQFDFTVKDYLFLSNALALKHLKEIKESNYKRFSKILKHGRIPPSSGKNTFVEAISEGMKRGFWKDGDENMKFEFKIPVAVPEERLIIQLNPTK